MTKSARAFRLVAHWTMMVVYGAIAAMMVYVWIEYVRGTMGDMPIPLLLIPFGAILIVPGLVARWLVVYELVHRGCTRDKTIAWGAVFALFTTLISVACMAIALVRPPLSVLLALICFYIVVRQAGVVLVRRLTRP